MTDMYQLYKKFHSKFFSHPVPEKTFLEWFIGFFEGDGSFNMQKRKGRKTPEFSLSVKQKDKRVLGSICDNFGYGTIYQQKDGYYRLVFQRQEMILCLIALFDGNIQLVSEKYKFEKWAACFLYSLKNSNRVIQKNQKNKQLAQLYFSHLSVDILTFSQNLQDFRLKRNLKESVLDLNSAWLSGFMQAEGSFSAQLFLSEKPQSGFWYAIVLRISFRQNESYSFFQLIKKHFGGCIKSEGKSWKITLSSKKAVDFFHNYFLRFPLKGRKKIAQDRWIRVVRLRNKKIDLPPQTSLEFRKLKRLIDSVNKCQH